MSARLYPAALTAIVLCAGPLAPWSPLGPRCAEAATADPVVAAVQRDLTALGFDPGPADGLIGARTRGAIRAYQEARGLPVDGRATPALRGQLAAETRGGSPATERPVAAPGQTPATEARDSPPAGELPASALRARLETEARTAEAQRTADIAVVQTRADPGSITAPSSVRPAPERSADETGLLAQGTRVEVMELRGRWARVRAPGGVEGWVPSGNVRIGATEDPAAAPKDGGGPSWLRRLTGWLGRGRGSGSRETDTVTIGIRGLTADDVRAATPDPGALQGLDSYAASDERARAHAAGVGLLTQDVAYEERGRKASGSWFSRSPSQNPAGRGFTGSDR
jgi:hypothetical protein